jgi:hypothetical protein
VLTVSATAVVVERQLGSGELACPGCGARLRAWGFARSRVIAMSAGAGERLRPRRGRCSGCRVTHVLLPVSCLLRRAYSVDVVGAALSAKAAGGGGHRSIAAGLGVPATTVRGWLRRFAGRAEAVRVFFTRAAIATGVDVGAPGPAPGGSVADAVAALGLLWAAARQRFEDSFAAGVGGWQVACSASGGRLLSPSWPLVGANTSSP